MRQMGNLRLRCMDRPGERLIALLGAVAKHERLTGSQAVRVKLGLLTSQATLTVHREGKEEERPSDLQMSPDLLTELNLKPGLRCSLRIDRGAGTVVLGPVVGVFVNPRFLASIELGDVPESASYHARAAWDTHAFLYYFSHEQIDWLARTATAWVYEGRGSWSRRTAPLPDVVYDRGVNFRDEEKPLVKYVRAQFRSSPLVQRINARDALDKWWLFRRLARYTELKPHLPETVRYHGLSEVQELLGRYGRVFLKSFYGRGGTEVLAIEQDGHGGYLCCASNLRRHCGSLQEVLAVSQRFFPTDRIVVQQGIPLLRHQGRKLDLRVLLNKDGHGKWQVTYNQVRVASGKSPVTNVHCHGKPFAFRDLMPTVLGARDRTAATEREVADFCTDVVRCIEREYGPFGELGLDVALDDQGGIWLLEANAKPDKNPEAYEAGPPYPQFTRLLEYAKHLAGFSPADWQIT